MVEEYIEDGFVLLSRKIFSSKTFSSLNAIQKLITIYLILMANHKDNEWWDNYHKKFITIKRGSFITSIEGIKKKINDKLITTKKIRLILSTLRKMEFLAIEKASGYSHITILKYNLYQDMINYKGKRKGNERARQGQGKGKARATNNNDNNDNNGKNKEKRGDIFVKTLKDFKEMRIKIKKPMTEKAEELLLINLNKLSKNEGEQVAILNQSILNCWQGVYALKDKPQDDEAQPKWEKKEVLRLTPEQVARDKARMKELANVVGKIGNMPGTAKGG